MINASNGNGGIARAMVPVRIVLVGLLLLAVGMGGCATQQGTRGGANPAASGSVSSSASGLAVAPTAPPPVPVVSFESAITTAAEQMFQSLKLDGDNGSVPLQFVIDPLIDGSTGAQSKATQYIQNRVVALTKDKYTRFQVQDFTSTELDKKPLVLVGTFNTINQAAEMKGDRYAWWICLVMVDLRSGKVVARGAARAQLAGADVTPLDYFKDSPAWSADDATSSYVRNCQMTKVGDPADPKYLDGLLAASLIAQAIEAYDDRRYRQALDLYLSAATVPGGDQMRLYVGLYLTQQKLGNRADEDEAFRKLVDYGLMHKRLAVKFLFRPGSIVFVSDRQISAPYEMWLRQIAREAAARDVCLEVTGHTTPTGFPPINDRLSLLRAAYVRDRLSAIEPPLAPRIIANGLGSRETLVGTGKDDESDVLDRRVEFKVIDTACGKPA
jgi:outer membrane protein OmpA-like peptidoglycan-associated protein